MFDLNYKEWCRRKSKTIIDFYGYKFFHGKKVLDLGSGNGDIAAALARLGADVLCVDARQENINLIKKNYSFLKTLLLDLDNHFPQGNFDIVLSLGVLCHLKNFEKHIKEICNVAEHIILETEVLDSINHTIKVPLFEEKSIVSLSFHGEGSLVSSGFIQNKLSSIGATFKRIDETKMNYGPYRYDWIEQNLGRKFGNRRFWFIRRDKYIAQLNRNKENIRKAEEAAAIKIFPTINPIPEQEIKIVSEKDIEVKPNLHNTAPSVNYVYKNPKIRLFYNYYEDQSIERKKEIDFCLNKNIDNSLFEIIILESEKNPTFNFFFEKINILSGPDDINIICNSDIFFDQTISLVSHLKHKELYALSRWEWYSDKSASSLRELNNSQDTWICRGKVENVNGDFQLGKPSCDNRIAYEFNIAGYKVSNPSRSIKTYHYHNSSVRYYNNNEKIEGPTLFVDISNL